MSAGASWFFVGNDTAKVVSGGQNYLHPTDPTDTGHWFEQTDSSTTISANRGLRFITDRVADQTYGPNHFLKWIDSTGLVEFAAIGPGNGAENSYSYTQCIDTINQVSHGHSPGDGVIKSDTSEYTIAGAGLAFDGIVIDSIDVNHFTIMYCGYVYIEDLTAAAQSSWNARVDSIYFWTDAGLAFTADDPVRPAVKKSFGTLFMPNFISNSSGGAGTGSGANLFSGDLTLGEDRAHELGGNHFRFFDTSEDYQQGYFNDGLGHEFRVVGGSGLNSFRFKVGASGGDEFFQMYAVDGSGNTNGIDYGITSGVMRIGLGILGVSSLDRDWETL